MKLSVNWLKDYVSFKLKQDELIHQLTMLGLEVEKTHSVGNDTVFELEITPNRPDCLNVIGIAREVSAGLNVSLKEPVIKKFSKPSAKCLIDIQDKQGCRRYIGTVIENVQISSSPAFIKDRLQAIGSRLINNVVDVTNFCLMEQGQPLHAFDLDKLQGKKIIVRRAKKGEKILTIDGVERELDESILVIADEKKPVAIAGIMGGKETEVTDQTKNILLESAWFDPILIRRAARKLSLSSDSSYRFERGVDYDGVEKTSLRATDLILSYAKGEVSSYNDVSLEKPKKSATISLSVAELNAYLGSEIKTAQCKNILTKLGCQVTTAKDILKVAPPTFRNDLKKNVDLVEEIARVVGFDELPENLPQIKITSVISSPVYKFKNLLRQSLVALGLSETITFTMYPRRVLERSNLTGLNADRLKNPLSLDQEIMRPSILPSLLNVALNNFNNGQKELKLFEIGKTYMKGKEKEFIALMLTGTRTNDWRLEKKAVINFFDMKGVVQALVTKISEEEISVASVNNIIFEDEESVEVSVSGKQVGILGRLKEDVLQKWDIKTDHVFYAEIDIEALRSLYKEKKTFKSIPEYPSVQRDISLAIKEDIKFSQVKDIARRLGKDILTSIQFREEYLGDKIGSGQRGIVFSLNYQSASRTLKEEEVASVHEAITQALIKDLQAVRR